MAKAKQNSEQQDYPLTHCKDELDVLWILWHVCEKNDPKLLKRTLSRMRAKLGHRIAPRIFQRMLTAEEPFALINDIIDNYLAKPPPAEIDLSKHGVAQVIGVKDGCEVNEYVYLELSKEREDMLYAQRYEVLIMEDCAIQATQACEMTHATVNVTMFKDHGFSGTTHQFEIGS